MITDPLDVRLVQTLNSALLALAGCIDESGGDVRDMCLRTTLTAADALLMQTAEGEEPEVDPFANDEDEPAKVATDDPTTCGHPQTFPPLPNGQVMCASCGASQIDGEWRVL